MDRLRCVVERITYQNETNGYSVIKVKPHTTKVACFQGFSLRTTFLP